MSRLSKRERVLLLVMTKCIENEVDILRVASAQVGLSTIKEMKAGGCSCI